MAQNAHLNEQPESEAYKLLEGFYNANPNIHFKLIQKSLKEAENGAEPDSLKSLSGKMWDYVDAENDFFKNPRQTSNVVTEYLQEVSLNTGHPEYPKVKFLAQDPNKVKHKKNKL